MEDFGPRNPSPAEIVEAMEVLIDYLNKSLGRTATPDEVFAFFLAKEIYQDAVMTLLKRLDELEDEVKVLRSGAAGSPNAFEKRMRGDIWP